MGRDPFVGRGDELAGLAQLAAEPADRGVTAVLIRGRAGVGKSRLIDAWLERLPSDTFVLRGGADTFDRGFPYGALDDAVSALLRRPGDLGGARPAVTAYRALLRGRRGELGSDPHGVTAALLETLTTVTDRPAVVVLEDAHLADPDTLRVCALLTRHTGVRLLLVVTLRPGHQATAPLESYLARLGERERAAVLDLAPLSAADTGALFTDLLGFVPPGELAARLTAWTGGNPFFIHAVASQLARAAQGQQVDRLADWEPSPDPWLAGRLAAPGSTEREVARMLAISHRIDEARVALLPGLLDRSPDEVADAVDNLVAQGVLIPSAPGHVFGHDLIKESFLTDLGPERSRLLRGRLGEALLRQRAGGAAGDIYELAQLLAGSRVAPDPAIVPILVEAAERAARNAPLVAAGWFAEARRFAGGTPEADGFLLRETSLLSLAGRSGAAWQVAADGLARRGAAGEVPVELAASGAAVALAAGHPEEAIRVSELLPPDARPTLVRVSRAMALLTQWRGVEGAAEYESALAAYRAHGDPHHATGLLLYNCARLLARSDDLRELGQRIEDSIRADANPHTELTQLAALAEMSMHGSDGLRGAVHADPRLSIERLACSGWPMSSESAVLEGFYLEWCYLRGKWDAILEVVPSIEALRERSLVNTVDLARLYAGAVHGARGDIDELRRMLADQPIEPAPWLSGFLAVVRSRVLIDDGRLEAAIDLLLELHERAVRAGILVQDAAVVVRLVALLNDVGRNAEARQLAEASLARERVLDRPLYLSSALDAYGTAFADIDALRQAKAIFVEHGLVFANAQTCFDLALLGERPAENLATAYRLFAGLKVRPGRQRAVAEMRRRGIPLPRRGRRAGADFSDVEREIVELVAAGRTNGEIAQELNYSAKTIEMHLTRIYRRTGAGNRVGLVQAVASGRLRLPE